MKFTSKCTMIAVAGALGLFAAMDARADASPAMQAAASKSVTVQTPAAVKAAALRSAVSIATQNAQQATSEVGGSDAQNCIQGSDPACEQLFRQIMTNLQRLMTPDFRIANKVFLLNPSGLQYDKETAVKLANLIVKK